MMSRNFLEIKKLDFQPLKRIPFKTEEDEKLRQLVKKYGENDWNLISKFMPNRSARQCHDRWNNSLSSNILKEKWNSQEDFLLKQKYFQYGPKWKFFERFFPGRTSYNIKNRWSCLVRLSNLCSEELKRNQKNNSQLNENNTYLSKNLNENVKFSYIDESNKKDNLIGKTNIGDNQEKKENQEFTEFENQNSPFEFNDDIYDDNYFNYF